MSLVIDASIALAWVLPDEREDIAQVVLDRVLREGAAAPALWGWEVQNALCAAERRKRIDLAGVHEALARLRAIGIVLHPRPPLGREYEFARKHSLTAYDAAYLDLALRGGMMLATADRALAVAANRLGVLAEETISAAG